MLQCFVCSLIPKVSVKKGATGQSFIQKEITSHRIGTLVNTEFLYSLLGDAIIFFLNLPNLQICIHIWVHIWLYFNICWFAVQVHVIK